MKLRQATEADQQVLRELWEEFEAEIPAPPEFVETWDEEWKDVAADIGGRGVVYLAEDDDGVAGAVRATMLPGHVWHIVLAVVAIAAGLAHMVGWSSLPPRPLERGAVD